MDEDYAQEEKNKTIAMVASILFILAFIFLVYFLLDKFVLNTDFTELREGHKDESYCQMVKLYLDTNGKEGWRDYRGIYYKECLKQ